MALVAAASHVLAGAAFGAVITSATFSGNGGTASVGGTFFARTGSALTLTIVTDTATNCVALSGAHTATTTTPTSVNGSKTWTIALTAAAGADGPRTTTITARDDAACTGSSSSVDRSYTVDNTPPTLSAGLSSAANAPGWHNQNLTITWSAADSGSGVGSGPTPATDSQTVNTGGVTKTSTASDRVGNVGNGSVFIKLDKDAPLITANRNPAANANGWNNTNVTVSFTCSDTRSGVRSCSGSTTLTTNGTGQTVTGNAVDVADNTASTTATVNIDKLAPTLSGAPALPPNSAGWYNADVTVAWTCDDTGGSGFAVGACASTMISGEGTGLVSTKTVSDLAGNSSGPATSSPAVNLDKTAPVTTVSAVPGWTQANVDVTLAGADGLSGVASTQFAVDGGPTQTYSGPLSFTSEGMHVIDYWSVDNAGNSEAPQQATVRIDRTAPVVVPSQSPVANANGWNNTDVTVSFDCADAGSGVASCSGPQTVSTEGATQDVSGTGTDNAGNSAQTNTQVSVDKTAPTLTGVAAPEANANGWNSTDVTVTFTCSDSLSGIDACPSPTTLTEEGAGQAVSGTATDNAGNSASATVSDVNIDTTAPSLSGAATTAPNASGWYRSNVTVEWTCADSLSGVAGGCPAATTVTGESSNLSASASVSDRAGNQVSASVTGLRIDRTAPTAAVVGVTPGATYPLGGYTALCTSTDALSGVATPATLSTSGGPTGAVTLTCDGAVDAAGSRQTAPASVTINVVSNTPKFSFGDFLRPLLAPPRLNDVKAGAAVPVKFSLGGFRGMNIFEAGFPRSAPYTCPSGPDSARTWAPSQANGGLTYDAATDIYTYVWKTEKGFNGSCRVLAVKFSDGSGQRALFRLDR